MTLRNNILLLIALASLSTGCTAVNEKQLKPAPQAQIEYFKNDWRVCRGDNCLAPTKKTVFIYTPAQKVTGDPIAAVSSVTRSAPASINVEKGWMDTCSGSPFAFADQGDKSPGGETSVTLIVHFLTGEVKPSPQGLTELKESLKSIRSTKSNIVVTGFAADHLSVSDTCGSHERIAALAKARAKFIVTWLRGHKVYNLFIIKAKWRTDRNDGSGAKATITFKPTTKEKLE